MTTPLPPAALMLYVVAIQATILGVNDLLPDYAYFPAGAWGILTSVLALVVHLGAARE